MKWLILIGALFVVSIYLLIFTFMLSKGWTLGRLSAWKDLIKEETRNAKTRIEHKQKKHERQGWKKRRKTATRG